MAQRRDTPPLGGCMDPEEETEVVAMATRGHLAHQHSGGIEKRKGGQSWLLVL